jgi:predicted HTH transcriptional regulator
VDSNFRSKILQLINAGESSDCEFKSAWGGFPGSFWETYSAMANENGGVILLGATEKEGSIRLDGLTLDQISKYKKNLWDDLHNKSKANLNLLTAENVQIINIEGRDLLAISIPRATRTQRPIYIGPTPFGKTYRRRHEGDLRLFR